MSTTLTATGVLFMSKTRPLALDTAAGEFQLTMLAYDRLKQHQVESWRLYWLGEEARAWYAAHKEELTPGRPIDISATNIHIHSTGAFVRAEVHATLLACKPLPMRRDEGTAGAPASTSTTTRTTHQQEQHA